MTTSDPVRRAAAGRWGWPVVIGLAVVVANLPGLVGLVDVNPLATWSGLGVAHGGQLLPGLNTVDPNVGLTSQALGHLAALDWLHGHIPWWNPYEGVGTPLAAGMQSAAFFPPTLLLAFSDGQLPYRLLLELVAGLATYVLVLQLGMRRWIAGVAGVLFALNGTFSWYQHAEINPICLLPVCLVGVELARRHRLGNWRTLVLPAGIALSIVAGFPETAYLDGLFVAVWGLVRAAQAGTGERLRLAGRLVFLAAGGIALAAPLLVAFLDYLRNANIGGHAAFELAHLPTSSLITLGVPYVTGPLKAFGPTPGSPEVPLFTTNSGYLTVAVIALAGLGLVRSRRELAVRVLCAAWVAVGLARSYGFVPLERAVVLVPELRHAAVFRAVFPSAELAMILLAALGLEAAFDVAERRRWHLATAAGATAALMAVFALGPGRRLLDLVAADGPDAKRYMVAAGVWAGLVLAALAVAGALRGRSVGRALVCCALVLDAVASFAYPQFAAPRDVTIDVAPVAYLQSHLGYSRFYTLLADPSSGRPTVGGPIAPNYGSFYGIASANYLDVPVPESFASYVHSSLDSGAGSEFFTGTQFGRGAGVSNPYAELVAHLRAFEQLGVRYLVAGAHQPVVASVPGAQRVFDDGHVAIYELRAASSYFSTAGARCTLEVASRTQVTATCAGPAALERRELSFPGWHASVNGHAVSIAAGPVPFMSLALPPGRSVVTFGYEPTYVRAAEVLAFAALLTLAAPFVASAGPVRRRRRRGGPGGGDAACDGAADETGDGPGVT